MTFSDSRIAKMLEEDFVPSWESVSPVRVVTFNLGEGRSLKGTVNGEIAIYFCDSNGLVFDILPALQSPAITLQAMKSALEFYQKHEGEMTEKVVIQYHRQRMEKVAAARYDQLVADGKPIYKDVKDLPAELVFPESKKGETKRERYINAAMDGATEDLRLMSMSKTFSPGMALRFQFVGDALTVVEPGGKGYYQWQIDRAFLGLINELPKTRKSLKESDPDSDFHEPVYGFPIPGIPSQAWGSSLKKPSEWTTPLFEQIFKQELKGGVVEYNSDSLEAISIIEE